jgi:transposase-like protein
MSEDDVLFGYRLRVLDHAARTSVSEACRVFGIHRSTFYVWKRRVERHGLEILRPRERRRPRMPQQLSPFVEERIVAFARVVRGTRELTDGIDVTPSMREENLVRLEQALKDLNARRADGASLDIRNLDEPVVEFETRAGELKLVPEPAGTRGYDDLRRRADREPLGRGIRPQVASGDDLARMLGALDREQDVERLLRLRRLMNLEHSLSHELGRGREIEI